MNSRSVNEKSLVNYSVDLSTLNPLDSKDGLLSFPFDHLYACHSDNADRRQTIQLDKELEIATHCVVGESSPKEVVVSSGAEVSRLAARLTASENQNKKLKELLVYHLDLIQQQNDHFSKKEKVYQALKQENESLKSRLTRMDRRVAISQRHSVNPPPLVHVPSTNVTSTVVKTEPGQQQLILNSYTELLLPSDSRTNSFIFDNDINKTKTFGQDAFELTRTPDSGVTNYLTGELSTAVLDNNINCENFTMIESKRSLVKKEIKTENHPEALYTVTSNSNPVIQRIQRNRRRPSAGMGTVSRVSKSPAVKLEPPESSKTFEDEKPYERALNVNKKSKMINTYGKSRSNAKRTSQLTGSLSDRLQLIDTTPTGEDPYQLGEADMREQSPIPKLMLQKTNHGRMKICTDQVEAQMADAKNKIKIDRYNLSTAYVHGDDVKLETPKTILVAEPDLDIVKTETEIDWQVYETEKGGNETGLCEFSYGENANNIALDAIEFQELFTNDATLALHNYQTEEGFGAAGDKATNDKSKRRNVRTTSLVGPNVMVEEPTDSKRGVDCKRGRKRALSTTGLAKNVKREPAPKLPAKPKLIKGKAASRGPKSPLPGMVASEPYHTLVGDPDLTWYLGLDPDVKMEDVDQDTADTKISTVEVPRWREKPYTSCYTMEGTENLDDKVFEKRHQKLEAEERRQLRWHMRRIREQRHVERLRQRQRDPWAGGVGAGVGGAGNPPAYTVWPQPQRDARFIEITDALPVTAFGEILPALPDSDFVLPWVRISKALKRSKRSKTLH